MSSLTRIIVMSALLIVSTVVCVAQTPGTAEEFYNRGVDRQNARDFQGAIADYTKALELNPRLSQAYLNRGNAQRATGDLDAAMADYNKAIKTDEAGSRFVVNSADIKLRLAGAYHNRGLINKDRGDYDAAIADLSKALTLNAQYYSAYANRAYARSHKGDVDGSIADFTKAIELYEVNPRIVTRGSQFDAEMPGVGNTYFSRGILFESKSEFDRAIVDWTKAIELNSPLSAVAYGLRGLARLRQCKDDEAVADLKKAFEIKPSVKSEMEAEAATIRQKRKCSP